MKKILSRVLSMVATLTLVFSTNAWAQLGSSSSDLVFTPITPCRLLDTRSATTPAGTPIAANSTRSFLVWNQTSFAIQGGAATNCGLTASSNTAALAINFTVVAPATAGFITAFPANVAKPLAATLNYEAGSVRGNSAIVKIAQNSSTALSVFTTSQTHVVADVVGYYAQPVATALECVNTITVTGSINTGPVNGVYYGAAQAGSCPAGYTSTGTACWVSDATASSSGEYGGVGSGACAGNSIVANTFTVGAARTCCRIPGR